MQLAALNYKNRSNIRRGSLLHRSLVIEVPSDSGESEIEDSVDEENSEDLELIDGQKQP